LSFIIEKIGKESGSYEYFIPDSQNYDIYQGKYFFEPRVLIVPLNIYENKNYENFCDVGLLDSKHFYYDMIVLEENFHSLMESTTYGRIKRLFNLYGNIELNYLLDNMKNKSYNIPITLDQFDKLEDKMIFQVIEGTEKCIKSCINGDRAFYESCATIYLMNILKRLMLEREKWKYFDIQSFIDERLLYLNNIPKAKDYYLFLDNFLNIMSSNPIKQLMYFIGLIFAITCIEIPIPLLNEDDYNQYRFDWNKLSHYINDNKSKYNINYRINIIFDKLEEILIGSEMSNYISNFELVDYALMAVDQLYKDVVKYKNYLNSRLTTWESKNENVVNSTYLYYFGCLPEVKVDPKIYLHDPNLNLTNYDVRKYLIKPPLLFSIENNKKTICVSTFDKELYEPIYARPKIKYIHQQKLLVNDEVPIDYYLTLYHWSAFFNTYLWAIKKQLMGSIIKKNTLICPFSDISNLKCNFCNDEKYCIFLVLKNKTKEISIEC